MSPGASLDLSNLANQVGLLLATCEQEGYFEAGDVARLDIPWDVAVERYEEAGLPDRGSVIFQSWGRKPVLLGLLPEPDKTSAIPFVRCAAAAMPTLGAAAIDMLVLLIGPEGSEDSQEWLRVAALIEIDDRVCRKLVWLPGRDATRSAEDFLSKTPFARPWLHAKTIKNAASLNRVSADEDALDRAARQAERAGATASEFLKNALQSLQA